MNVLSILFEAILVSAYNKLYGKDVLWKTAAADSFMPLFTPRDKARFRARAASSSSTAADSAAVMPASGKATSAPP